MFNEGGEKLRDLRRVTYRLVDVDVETSKYNESTDHAFILFKEDVEPFIRKTIRLHGKKDSKRPFLQYLRVECPGIHYAPSFALGDECSYIPMQSWQNPLSLYNSTEKMGLLYYGSILRARDVKRQELEKQYYQHQQQCSNKLGGDGCHCKLINVVPEWIEPYVDPYFEELFDVDLEAEHQRFDDKFRDVPPTFKYY